MAGAQSIEIKKSPWYQAEADTPPVSQKEFTIKVNLLPARNNGRSTTALLGAYRLPGRMGDWYGSRIPGAMTIAAINQETGFVCFNHAEPSHTVPIEEVIDPDTQPDPNELQRVAVEGMFNFDIAKQLGIPPEKGEYVLFAWIDEITSDVQTVRFEEDKERHKGARIGQVDSQIVTFEKSPPSPRLGRIPIMMLSESDQAVAKPTVNDVTVYGAVSPTLLPVAPPAADEPFTYLTIMAVGARDRKFRWHSIELPDEVIEGKQCFFEFNLGTLVDQTDPPQKAFVLAVLGEKKSDVLVVDV